MNPFTFHEALKAKGIDAIVSADEVLNRISHTFEFELEHEIPKEFVIAQVKSIPHCYGIAQLSETKFVCNFF